MVSFLFELLLAADANFRMVRKKVSSEAADPTLSAGWSYFCETTKYRAHLEKYGSQKEVVRIQFHLFIFIHADIVYPAFNVCQAPRCT